MAIGGGTLSMSTIAGEYGGSTPHSLSEYYRGGGLVPTHSNTAGIPSSGLIDFEDFQNTSATSPSDMYISGNVGSWYRSVGKGDLGYGGVNVTNSSTYTDNLGTMGSWNDNSMNINGTARTATHALWSLQILAVNTVKVHFNASMNGLVSSSNYGTVVASNTQVTISGLNGVSLVPQSTILSGFPATHSSVSDNGFDLNVTFS